MWSFLRINSHVSLCHKTWLALLTNFHHPIDLSFVFFAEPKGQLLLIDGKTEAEVCRSLERVLLTMRITTSEPKV